MIRWTLIILGEPCQRGTAEDTEQAVADARKALKARTGLWLPTRPGLRRRRAPGGTMTKAEFNRAVLIAQSKADLSQVSDDHLHGCGTRLRAGADHPGRRCQARALAVPVHLRERLG